MLIISILLRLRMSAYAYAYVLVKTSLKSISIHRIIAPFRIYSRLKSECPLTLSQSWHMMKNQNFSYSSQR